MKLKSLLFDLDGTLTDPREGLVNCVRFAFDSLGRACPPEDVLVTFIGPPLRPMFATLLETTDTTVIEHAVASYRQRYAEIGVYETQAYSGVATMLRDCGAITPQTFLATSKPTVFAKRIIRHLGFEQHFARVYGVELDGRFDNKAELLHHLLEREALTPESCAMIGDRAADIVAAKANEMSSIGVLWGYGSKDELMTAGADIICGSPQELTQMLSSAPAFRGRP